MPLTLNGARLQFGQLLNDMNSGMPKISVPQPDNISFHSKVIDKSFSFDTTIEKAQRAINAENVEAQSTENGIGLVNLMDCYSGNMLVLSFMHRK
ncbi:hypothetical protein T459_30745 [Capsicum annuum]|uniref:Uncharacterized protein n=1 Tax=Capsicum annuum TaxID=4072 RepID=A0A2G2Y9A3_CAPAN|nr:hypothetical protein T459_30745 [Capsicum annuum]